MVFSVSKIVNKKTFFSRIQMSYKCSLFLASSNIDPNKVIEHWIQFSLSETIKYSSLCLLSWFAEICALHQLFIRDHHKPFWQVINYVNWENYKCDQVLHPIETSWNGIWWLTYFETLKSVETPRWNNCVTLYRYIDKIEIIPQSGTTP